MTTTPTPQSARQRSDLVPGVMHCAKCKFQLNRVTLCVSDGNAYAGDNKTEPCPNGCGPLWPVTWEQEAKNCWKALEEMHERLMATAAPAQPAAQQGVAYAAPPDERAAFEVQFPVPGGVHWDGTEYVVKDSHVTSYRCNRFEGQWEAWKARASHGQASSQAGEYPALVCDYCGALTPDPWHSSGMLHGKMSKHIHSCDACAARVGAAVQQDAARESEYRRVYRHGYEQRDAEVRGAMA